MAIFHSVRLVPDRDQSSAILNHYPQLGTKFFEVYPFFIAHQQLYLCISSLHHAIITAFLCMAKPITLSKQTPELCQTVPLLYQKAKETNIIN